MKFAGVQAVVRAENHSWGQKRRCLPPSPPPPPPLTLTPPATENHSWDQKRRILPPLPPPAPPTLTPPPPLPPPRLWHDGRDRLTGVQAVRRTETLPWRQKKTSLPPRAVLIPRKDGRIRLKGCYLFFDAFALIPSDVLSCDEVGRCSGRASER